MTTKRPWTANGAEIRDSSIPGYLVSSDGRVFSRKRASSDVPLRELTPFESGRGYLRVHITLEDGQRVWRSVHSLVARAFHGEPPDGFQVCHINGNPKDNRALNLKWGTAKDNADDRDRHGRTVRGSNINHSRLTEDAVRAIKSRLATGETCVKISRDYPVAPRAISRIKRKISWAHIQLRAANPAAFDGEGE